MIKKFITIKGTGKFLDYGAGSIPGNTWNREFKKINLIYGENGSGKTTLTLILKSLKNDSSILPNLRSFDITVPQLIEILTDDATNPKHTFDNNAWDRHFPEIEIFDTHFVNENIFTGLAIQSSHKKNLFEVIFGQQGVLLKSEIQDIKNKIIALHSSLREISYKISFAIENTYAPDAYCLISVDPDIDNKIQSKQREITTAKSFALISTKQPLATIPLFSSPIDKENAIKVLSKSIDSISQTYIQIFKNHKRHLRMDGNEEQWIKQGFDAITGERCPFCLRKLDDTIEIIEAYKQYFNTEYKNLVSRVSELHAAVDNFNIEAELLEIENKIAANQILIDFWTQHVPNPPSNDTGLPDKVQLISSFASMKTTFDAKGSNPINAQNTDTIIDYQVKADALNRWITNLNNDVTAYNLDIASLRSSGVANITLLESELKKFKAIKKRGEPAMIALCDDLIAKLQELEQLDIDKNAKQKELDIYSETVFRDYSGKINQYLHAFAPYLEVRDLSSRYITQSTEPQVKFGLFMCQYEIQQDDVTYPSFKYSFSEGDKSALALAFFLTKLEVEGNLQNKVIIFDDPISSFDLNRKSLTITNLILIGQVCKQLFVLTHNIIFGGEFWREATLAFSSSCQCCRIGFLNNTSVISEYDIDSETLYSVLKDYLTIEKYLNTRALNDEEKRKVARCIRPVLEGYLRIKYFNIFPKEGLGLFIDKIENALTGDVLFRLNACLQELKDINNYSKRFHHAFNTNADSEPIPDEELNNYCNKTLKFIQSY